MEQSTSRGRGSARLQSWGSKPHKDSQLPVSTDLANVLAMSHQASATDNRCAVDGAQTANPFGNKNDITKVAQAAIGYRPKPHHQVSDMESIKALLRNFLDDIKEPQKDRSSYCDGLLSQWLDLWRRDRTYSLLIYVLGDCSERYQDRTLDFNDLETIDKIKTQVLEQQCLQQGFCLHLARMTSAVNTDPGDVLALKMAISLHEIRDLSGAVLGNKPVAVGRESIIQKSLLNKRYYQQNANGNPYPSPTEGTPSRPIDTTKSFQDWVLLIMPEGYRFRFLTENADLQALHDWIKEQSAELQLSENDLTGADPNVRWGLTLACKTQLNNISTSFASKLGQGDPTVVSRYSEMLGAVVCASLRLQDPELFQMAVTHNPRMLPLTVWEEIGRQMDLAQSSSYRNSLNRALSDINSLQDRYIILFDIRVGCETRNQPQESMETVHNWIQERFEQALNEIGRVEEHDGTILVIVAKNYAQAIAMNRIISFARRHSANQPFAIEFAFSLYDELIRNTIDPEFAKYALAEILSAAVPALCVRGGRHWSHYHGFPLPASTKAPGQDQQLQQADRMARLVCCCLTVGLRAEEHALLRHIWLGASVADAPTLQHVFLPYLKNLLMVMREHRIPLTTQSYQWQFQQVISLFITRFIGQEPTPLSPDLTCPPLGCAGPTRPYGCPTCLELDAFLVDPHRRTADVTGGIDAPEHVIEQIQGTDYLQMTVTSHSAEQMKSTIRITKNMTKPEEPDTRHDLWMERAIRANDSIQAICGDEEWKLLLGDKYDECMGLKAVRA